MKFSKSKIKLASFYDDSFAHDDSLGMKNALMQQVPGDPREGAKKPINEPKRVGEKTNEQDFIEKAKEVGSNVLEGALKLVDNVKTNIENKVKGNAEIQKEIAEKQVEAAKESATGQVQAAEASKQGQIQAAEKAKEGQVNSARRNIQTVNPLDEIRIAKKGHFSDAEQTNAAKIDEAIIKLGGYEKLDRKTLKDAADVLSVYGSNDQDKTKMEQPAFDKLMHDLEKKLSVTQGLGSEVMKERLDRVIHGKTDVEKEFKGQVDAASEAQIKAAELGKEGQINSASSSSTNKLILELEIKAKNSNNPEVNVIKK
jgi:hypothetical protein